MVSDSSSLLDMSVRAKRKFSVEEVHVGAEGTGRRRSSRPWKPSRNILENLECRVEETGDGGTAKGRGRSCFRDGGSALASRRSYLRDQGGSEERVRSSSPEFGELVKLEVANVWGLAGLEDRGEEDCFRGFPSGAAREPYVRLRKIHSLMASEKEKGKAVNLHAANLPRIFVQEVWRLLWWILWRSPGTGAASRLVIQEVLDSEDFIQMVLELNKRDWRLSLTDLRPLQDKQVIAVDSWPRETRSQGILNLFCLGGRRCPAEVSTF